MMPRAHKIGQVEFLSEKLSAARELSSCCVGVEAYLDRSAGRADAVAAPGWRAWGSSG